MIPLFFGPRSRQAGADAVIGEKRIGRHKSEFSDHTWARRWFNK